MLRTISHLVAVLLFFFVSVQCTASSSSSSSDKTQLSVDNKKEIKAILKKVADWQIANFKYAKPEDEKPNLHDYGLDSWTNATLYVGMGKWARLSDEDVYAKWLKNIGVLNNWQMPANFKKYPKYSLYHADELCIGQYYLDMYDLYKDESMLATTQQRLDWIMANPGDTSMNYKNKQLWSWCDALFMAPPAYAHMGKVKGDDRYWRFMDDNLKRTYNHLYNKEYKLFFRDDSYFGKREQNGEKIFWGRGNGWVAAGLANLLDLMSKNSSYRPFYEELFKEFIPQLASMCDDEGFWHASLLDPASYPSPETSATALIVYSIAYGINHDLLPKDKYTPILEKSWKALLSAVQADGKLGWVQPIGADPKKVTEDMTAVYGVGAFLLAGCEIYQMK